MSPQQPPQACCKAMCINAKHLPSHNATIANPMPSTAQVPDWEGVSCAGLACVGSVLLCQGMGVRGSSGLHEARSFARSNLLSMARVLPSMSLKYLTQGISDVHPVMGLSSQVAMARAPRKTYICTITRKHEEHKIMTEDQIIISYSGPSPQANPLQSSLSKLSSLQNLA